MYYKLDKDKVLAGVNACIQPAIANCQKCPYWNNGDKQCEELRLDIADFVHTAINLHNNDDWSGLQGGL